MCGGQHKNIHCHCDQVEEGSEQLMLGGLQVSVSGCDKEGWILNRVPMGMSILQTESVLRTTCLRL